MGTLDDGSIKQRVRSALATTLRELGVDRPVTPTELCAALGEQRGRPVELVEAPLPTPGPFALLVARSDRDQIVYPVHPSRSYQLLNIGHELTHLVLDHRMIDEGRLHHVGDDPPPADRPTGDVPVGEEIAGLVRRWGVLDRSSYELVIEREAEIGGSFLRAWLRTGTDERRRDPATEAIEDALGGAP